MGGGTEPAAAPGGGREPAAACAEAMQYAETTVFPFKKDTEAEIAAVRAQLAFMSPADRRAAELVVAQAEAEVADMEAALREAVRSARRSEKLLAAVV